VSPASELCGRRLLFVAYPAVEALDESVVDRLAWATKDQLHTVGLRWLSPNVAYT
jgi:hypothetical protein